jgi:hypothetical protein
VIIVGSRKSFGAWAAGAIAVLALSGLVLCAVAVTTGAPAVTSAGLGLASLGLLISSVNVYRLATRKRP